MTIVLIVIIILLILLLSSMTGLAIKNANSGVFWQEQYFKKDKEYSALEEGRDEESEAYEQQYLSFMDTIEAQATAIGSYIEDLHFLVDLGSKHFEHCLPEYGDPAIERFEGIKQSILLSEG